MSKKKRLHRARQPRGPVKRLPRSGYISTPVNLGGGRSTKDPAECLRRAIQDALDATKQPGPCRTLVDMTEEERAALEKEYGAPIVVVEDDAIRAVACVVKAMTEKAVKLKQTQLNGQFAVAWVPRRDVVNSDAITEPGPATVLLSARLARKIGFRTTAPAEGPPPEGENK